MNYYPLPLAMLGVRYKTHRTFIVDNNALTRRPHHITRVKTVKNILLVASVL